MKRILVLVTALLASIGCEIFACGTCGCGVTNYHYGILPQYHKNLMGIRYRYRSFNSRLDHQHNSPRSHEVFHTTELWGRFYPSKRTEIYAFIPYNFNVRLEGESSTRLHGVGDAIIAMHFNVIDTYDSTSTSLSHRLLLGSGLKLPTGKFDATHDGQTINQNFQIGTGSVDLLLNLIYTLRFKNIGLNTEFSAKYNTTNRDDYRFGNTSRTGITFFLLSQARKLTIMPTVGIEIETFGDNRQYDTIFTGSGGWAMLYNGGIEAFIGRVAFGTTYSNPVTQKLFDGNVSANHKLSCHFTVMF